MDNQLFQAIQHLVKDDMKQLNSNKSITHSREIFTQWATQISSTETAGLAWSLQEKNRLSMVDNVKVERWIYSTCGYCASGCGLFIGVMDGEAVAVKGIDNYPVNNGAVSCIKGLYQWKALNHPDRLKTPLIRKNGSLTAASWDEALELIATKITASMEELGSDSIGFYGSGQLLLEESYALAKLAKGVIGTSNIDANLRLCMASGVQGYLQSFGSDGPPGCFEDLDVTSCTLIFGCNPAEMHPVIWKRILLNRRVNGAKLIVVDPRKTIPAEMADIHLQLRTGTNLALLNGLLHVIITQGLIDNNYVSKHTTGLAELEQVVASATPEVTAAITGIDKDLIIKAAKTLGNAKDFVTLYVQGVYQSHLGTESSAAINNLHLVTGNIGKPGAAPFSVTGQCTSMSHREVGGSSNLPGYRSHNNAIHRSEVESYWGVKPGTIPVKTQDIFAMLAQIEQGSMKVLWNVATNPAVSLPNLPYVRRQLAKAFLVVQDIFPTETTEYADLVLPAAQWGEKTGTYTNAERRVNLGRQAVKPPGQAKTDLEIICLVAQMLGADKLFNWQNSEEVFHEWKGLSKGRLNDMAGITYERLVKMRGIQWPCPHEEHPGTARLYTDGQFPHQEGNAELVGYHYAEPEEKPSEEYPFWLNTGRLTEHYHTRVKTKRIQELNHMSEEGFVEINPEDAKQLGIAHQELVRLVSPRGVVVIKAKVSQQVLPGHLFAPFHFGDDTKGTNKAINHLPGFQLDKFSKQPKLKNSICRVEKLV